MKINKNHIVVLLLCTSLHASAWEVKGNIKAGLVNYNYNNPFPSKNTINKGHGDSHGIYFVPKFSIISPSINNITFKTTFAAATDFGINNPKHESRNFVFDNGSKKSFALLQEMYLKYKDKNHDIKVGRYELETPLIEPDDYYMLANSYETLSYTNTSLDSYTFHLGYISAMAGVWDSGANGEKFSTISETSFVDLRDKSNAGDSGVLYGAIEYKESTYKLKVWEYYISNLYNLFLAQYDFKYIKNANTYEIAFQFTDYQEVGKLASNSFTDIDYSIYALKFDGKLSNGFDFATGVSKFSDGEGISETLSAWGGFPTFSYGLIYNWFEVGDLRNASLYKAQVGYDLSYIGLKNTWIAYRYTYYDLDSKYSKTVLGDSQNSMRLHGIRLKYESKQGIYFVGNYEHRTLSHEPNSSAYRMIGGYKF